MRKLATLLLASATVVACDDMPTDPQPAQVTTEAAPAATGPAGEAMYEVTITNLTDGQPFTPPLAVTHRRPVELFRVGAPASVGVQQIAENGNLDPMLTAVNGDKHVMDVVVDVGTPPPVLPGETRSFGIPTERGARYISWISMLICTNDGFTGVDGARLPRDVGESRTWQTAGYDAGTEINTESETDLVPPCGGIVGGPDPAEGTGMSNPALAEGGVIMLHPGIQGGADLTVETHGWMDPVAEITVTRVN